MSAHNFDPMMNFCTNCGASRMQAVNGDTPAECPGPSDNVVVISNFVRGRRLGEIIFGKTT